MIDRLPAIIDEHEREGIGEIIYALIAEALVSQVRRYPLTLVLGRAVDRLDEQIRDELVIEFAEHLLGGRLAEALAHATGERHLLFLLRARARQFLQNRLRGGERENIAARTLRLLRTSRFVPEQRAEARWSIRGAPTVPVTASDDDLRRMARTLPIPASLRRFRRNTDIASAVLTDEDLEALIVRALEEAGGSLTIGQLRGIIEERLRLLPTETVSIYRRTDNEPALEDILESPNAEYEQADLAMLATDIVDELSERQLHILRLRLRDGRTREEAAEALGVSHSTIDNELARIRDIVLAATEHDVVAGKVVLIMIAGRTGPGDTNRRAVP